MFRTLKRKLVSKPQPKKRSPLSEMETEVVTVCKVPVKVLSFGAVSPSRLVKDPSSKPSELILVVTGNPGVTKFYIRFARRLHDKTKLPVWIVSHGGHERMPTPTLSRHSDLYNLEGQTKQKKELIETYLQGVKLRCVGHSIGAKMLLDLLKEPTLEKQIQSCYLLFPTIERMATTNCGESVAFVNRFFLWLVLAGSNLINMWPNIVKDLVLRTYCYIRGISYDSIPAIIDLIEPRVVRQAFFLVHDELQNVLTRDDETIKKNVGKIRLLYASEDGWAPVEYAEDLKKAIPDAQVEIDENGFQHSFVLTHSIPVADHVANWVKNDQVWVELKS